MKTFGIISEYNPFHMGHMYHIEKTRHVLGCDAYVVCVMSGNYVQRGDFAILNKHARAKTAISCGADLVIELPSAYVLSSAEGFAKAGVNILNSLGICEYISFGSEAGSIDALQKAADAIDSDKAAVYIKDALNNGLSYAAAQQKAADALLGMHSDIFKTPNNVLGIEYLKALRETNSLMRPITIKRTGGEHGSTDGWSASNLRSILASRALPSHNMPEAAVTVCAQELASGRSPVLRKNMEQAILSRLRNNIDFSQVPGASDGLDYRFMKAASGAVNISSLLHQVKTKRHTMSRIRRVLFNAVLGITNDDVCNHPAYIRVLAMNERGIKILKSVNGQSKLPIITKPASVKKLDEHCLKLFEKEARATDLYVLGYSNIQERTGGSEWRLSPIVMHNNYTK